jgi:hypothetical protein
MSTWVGPADAPPLGRAATPSFRRRRIVAALATAAVAAALFTALSAVGGDSRAGPLAWSGDREVFAHPTLPGGRVLSATLRNDGAHPVRVDSGDVRLLDADGRPVAATPVFLAATGRSLWSDGLSETELERTGRIAVLRPGEEVPLTIAWHAKDGDPVRVAYGRGWLTLPG